MDAAYDEERKYRGPEGGYGRGDGIGLRKVRHHSDIDNRSGVLNYVKHHRERSPLRYGAPAERRPRYNPEMEYRHYGHDDYPVRPANHGEKDSADDNSPNVFLLVRGLKESTSEEIFAKGMEKLYSGFENSSNGATPKSIRRVFRIRDKRTDQRMGHGFVEFHDIKDAIAALTRAREMERNKERLTISSQEFSIAYAHIHVFQTFDFGKPEYNDRFLFWINEKKLKYNDPKYYPCEFQDNLDNPHTQKSVAEDASDTEKKPKKANRETLENKSKKRKAPGAVPAYLEYYQRKQAELREDEGDVVSHASEPSEQALTGVNAIPAADTAMTDAPAEAPTLSDQQTFAHESEDRIACYLCNSAFNTRDGVVRHIRESTMHAAYLLDGILLHRAYKRMEAKEVDPDSTIRLPLEEKSTEPVKEARPQFRDRAAERRQEEAKAGVVQKVGFSIKGKGSKSSAARSNGASSDSEAEKGPAQPSYGKGMGMLQKAGWTAGQGLGAQGSEGRAAPIETNVYAAGVGLGHEGSKRGDAAAEAQRATDGNSFLEGTKETFRKRYEALN